MSNIRYLTTRPFKQTLNSSIAAIHWLKLPLNNGLVRHVRVIFIKSNHSDYVCLIIDTGTPLFQK